MPRREKQATIDQQNVFAETTKSLANGERPLYSRCRRHRPSGALRRCPLIAPQHPFDSPQDAFEKWRAISEAY